MRSIFSRQLVVLILLAASVVAISPSVDAATDTTSDSVAEGGADGGDVSLEEEMESLSGNEMMVITEGTETTVVTESNKADVMAARRFNVAQVSSVPTLTVSVGRTQILEFAQAETMRELAEFECGLIGGDLRYGRCKFINSESEDPIPDGLSIYANAAPISGQCVELEFQEFITRGITTNCEDSGNPTDPGDGPTLIEGFSETGELLFAYEAGGPLPSAEVLSEENLNGFSRMRIVVSGVVVGSFDLDALIPRPDPNPDPAARTESAASVEFNDARAEFMAEQTVATAVAALQSAGYLNAEQGDAVEDELEGNQSLSDLFIANTLTILGFVDPETAVGLGALLTAAAAAVSAPVVIAVLAVTAIVGVSYVAYRILSDDEEELTDTELLALSIERRIQFTPVTGVDLEENFGEDKRKKVAEECLQQTSLENCEGTAIYFPAEVDLAQAYSLRRDAISVNPDWIFQQRTSRTRKSPPWYQGQTVNGEPVGVGWPAGPTEEARVGCLTTGRPEEGRPQCDEFPNFSMVKGGGDSDPQPALRWVSDGTNSREGGFSIAFYRACGIDPDDGEEFLVIPLPEETEAPRTLWVCKSSPQ